MRLTSKSAPEAFVEYIGELPHLSITNPTEGWVPEGKKGIILIDNNYRLANSELTSFERLDR